MSSPRERTGGPLAGPDRWAEAALHLQGAGARGAVIGASGSVAPYAVARLAARTERPIVVVCADEVRADELLDGLRVFWRPGLTDTTADTGLEAVSSQILREVEVSPYSDLAPDRQAIMRRLGLLQRFAHEQGPRVTILSLRSLQRRTLTPEAFDSLCELVGVGEVVDREVLARRLVDVGYQRLPIVEDPGTFAVRGNVVDLFPSVYRFPVRLELDGDDVVSVRHFAPENQRTLRDLPHVFIHPVRETITTAGADPRTRLLTAADAANHPSSHTRFVLSQIEQGADFFGSEALTAIFHTTLAPVWEYFPEEAIWVVEHPDGLLGAAQTAWDALGEAYAERLDNHLLALPPTDLFVDPDSLGAHLAGASVLALRGFAAESEVGDRTISLSTSGHELLAQEVKRLQAERDQPVLNPLAARIRSGHAEGYRSVAVSPDGPTAERLRSLLAGHGLEVTLRQPSEGYPLPEPGGGEPRPSGSTAAVEIRIGRLREGFRLEHERLEVFAEEQLFGPKVRRRRRARGMPQIGDLSQLEVGNHVVHELHGVGRYGGLTREVVGGVPGDFMLIEYQGSDKLYLPVHRFKEVHRYVSAEGRPPRLDKMGGQTWARARRKATEAVRRLAEELLKLYAQRSALPGLAHAEPDELYRAFEAAFPFTETPDQAVAIEAVQGDMTSSKPMDRLVCGDVGYGKTEVAMRAAMLAALGGWQVAVLAPTTVLVEQHLATFAERFKGFPVNVAGLSRFRKGALQREIIAQLASGEVDVVVGTHRLLSGDVRFKKLGLIVVDEEQRFGVTHKERLKQLRTQCDVLTLTATPIPRTLHMSLMGLRDLSLIATPPADRLAVRTFVSATSPLVVRDAIRRELARGGQVYFVVPRIGEGKTDAPGGAGRTGIHAWAREIQHQVPEARVGIVHGQLDERELERSMAEFVAGRTDVLVCTSIVESGLDISRANTMLIDEADMFGLAQLYQLRGRIGRGKVRAYCILMVKSMSGLTPEARQRLEALQRFSDLGAGFSLATADLEIRGAGDLLGAKQSGSIAAVGFEDYVRIMEEAVAELKGEPLEREEDPDLTTDIPTFIPDDYLDDPGQRLHFYRRLSAVESESDAAAVLSEMADRYGEVPAEVDKLAALMVVKALAKELGAKGVQVTGARLSLILDETTRLKPDRVRDLVAQKGSLYRFTRDFRLQRRLGGDGDRPRLEEAKRALLELQASCT